MAISGDASSLQRQMALIRFSARAAESIVGERPGVAGQIVADYRSGSTHREIAVRYRIGETYGLGECAAITAVYRVIRELVPDEDELKVLETAHRRESGNRAYRGKTGIFSLDEKGIEERNLCGGESAGPKTLADGTGIHGLSEDKRARASRAAVVASGRTPFSEEEKRRLLERCEDPAYHRTTYPYIGFPDYTRISEAQAAEFGITRTPGTLRTMKHQLLHPKGK